MRIRDTFSPAYFSPRIAVHLNATYFLEKLRKLPDRLQRGSTSGSLAAARR
jgi:hypothetical protein